MSRTKTGLHPRVGELLQNRLPYDFYRCPKVVRNVEAARLGTNCVGLLHLMLGPERLSPNLHCHELFWDETNFKTLASQKDAHLALSQLEPLDVLHFGWRDLSHPRLSQPLEPIEVFVPEYDDGFITNYPRSPLTHVGMYSGARTESGDPLIFHASQEAGCAVLEPLSNILENPRYQQIYRVSRFMGASAVPGV